MVATLARRVGFGELEAIEDAVQAALARALETWTHGGQPDQPSAWLFRVAHNALLDDLRTRARRRRLLEKLGEELGREPRESPHDAGPDYLPDEVQDDLLRMLFACSEEAIPLESQLVLALKTLCGFSVGEIAARLFTSEASVYKRFERARTRLRELGVPLGELGPESYPGRLPAVQAILYLLFTEGHLSSRGEEAIRRELCDEALRLGEILASHPACSTPETCALLALMHLHRARFDARQDDSGLLLLAEQDRSRWDMSRVQVGLSWLARSAEGERFSRYHAEAGIAAEHCLAPSFAATRWDRIVACYELLEQTAPSALHRLNQAVALAEWRGPEAGLAFLERHEPPTWLAGSFYFSAVLADLHRRCGNAAAQERYRDLALETAPTQALRDVLERRLNQSGKRAH